MLRDRARGMRKQPSMAERALRDVVRNRQLGAKFRRQLPIDRYVVDFACIEAKLVVEVDGRSHDVRKQQAYDEARLARLNELGWCVLVVRDDDVLRDVSEVVERVAAALGAGPSP